MMFDLNINLRNTQNVWVDFKSLSALHDGFLSGYFIRVFMVILIMNYYCGL